MFSSSSSSFSFWEKNHCWRMMVSCSIVVTVPYFTVTKACDAAIALVTFAAITAAAISMSFLEQAAVRLLCRWWRRDVFAPFILFSILKGGSFRFGRRVGHARAGDCARAHNRERLRRRRIFSQGVRLPTRDKVTFTTKSNRFTGND